jgi:hypothetical protein
MRSHANMSSALRAISNPGAHGLSVNVPPGIPRPGTNNALGGVQGNMNMEQPLFSSGGSYQGIPRPNPVEPPDAASNIREFP